MPESELSDDQFDKYLIHATIYLGLTELTSTLLKAQVSSTSGTTEFSACLLLQERLEIAAYRGNLGMIRTLLATESTFEKNGYIFSHLSAIILQGGAMGGHKDVCDFALDKREPSSSSDREHDRHCQATGQMGVFERYEREVVVCESRYKDKGAGYLYNNLCHSAHRGNVQMVRYFLDRGACLNSPKRKRRLALWERAGYLTDQSGKPLPYATPLHAALNHIRNEPIVKMLLEHGVDPNWSLPELNPLKMAVKLNWLSAVRMLINYGANVNEGKPPPIVIAVEKENMEIFRFLRQKGAVLNTPETGSRAMALAKDKGLVSMVTVLVDAGVKEVPTTTEPEVKRLSPLCDYPLGYYMNTEVGKKEGGDLQKVIAKALENGSGY